MVMPAFLDDSNEVTKKLQSPSQPQLLRSWLDQQRERDHMRQQTKRCAFKAWLTLAALAIASTGIALYFYLTTADLLPTTDARHWFSLTDRGPDTRLTSSGVPLLILFLIGTNVLIVLALPLAWSLGRLPGFRSALSSVDWATAGDAMSRLLTIGCPYPDALRTTASVVSNGTERRWLLEAATRVETGGQIAPVGEQTPESTVLQTMLSSQETPMQRNWQLASEHYQIVAQRKIELLLGAVPILVTILAGLILWISVMATLGSMWSTLAIFMENSL